MSLVDVIKKIVLPVMTLASVVGSAYVTYVLAVVSHSLPGAGCTALLTLMLGYFSYRDARMLLGK